MIFEQVRYLAIALKEWAPPRSRKITDLDGKSSEGKLTDKSRVSQREPTEGTDHHLIHEPKLIILDEPFSKA